MSWPGYVTHASNREVALKANDLADAVGVACAVIAHGLLQRIEEAVPGPAAKALDGGGAPKGSHADPTATAGLRGTLDARNGQLAAQHRRELIRALWRASRAVAEVLAVAELYPEPKVADDEARTALARLNGAPQPSCQSCARIAGPSGAPRWEPIDSRLREATTAGGRLGEPWLLCCWCHDKVRLWGRLPSPVELVAHHEGHRVPWPADVIRPPSRKAH